METLECTKEKEMYHVQLEERGNFIDAMLVLIEEGATMLCALVQLSSDLFYREFRNNLKLIEHFSTNNPSRKFISVIIYSIHRVYRTVNDERNT